MIMIKMNFFVSYMKRTDAKGKQWLFLEEAQIHITHQVIKQNFSVRYSLAAIMRCSLDKQQYQDIEDCFPALLTA